MNATVPDAYHELISLYLRQWSVLRSRLKRQTGSHELAEDALQETWLRLSRMKGGPIDIRDQHAFILRVASNIAIDLARRENRHGGRCISDEAVLAAIEDACPSPERVVIDRDQLRLLVLATQGAADEPLRRPHPSRDRGAARRFRKHGGALSGAGAAALPRSLPRPALIFSQAEVQYSPLRFVLAVGARAGLPPGAEQSMTSEVEAAGS
jgi:RNA polymerase sigma-70 factor (ECF subfamily)